jgi:phosphate transport system permease protein
LSPFPTDARVAWLLRLAAFSTFAVIVLILGFLVRESWPALSRVAPGRFLSDPSWHPTEGLYNLGPMLAGTLLTSAGALALAVPLGVASALFGRYYAPSGVARLHASLIELLAGIPSVVFGFWGLTTLAPLVNQWHPPGTSLFTGILILALMILPTVALTMSGTLAAVPAAYEHGAAALGLSRWTTIRGIVLPSVRTGLATSVMLAAGRAAGETMAVLMVCGNVVRMPTGLFDPVRTLTANIALEMAYALGNHRAVLFVSGLVLMVLVLALVGAVEFTTGGRRHV